MSTDDVVAKYEIAAKTKQVIEEEIAAYVAELTSGQNPGVTGPLVDAEGFPRADVDVYRVRHVRHLLARKQTDHKQVMRTIEELLPQVFAARSSDLEKTSTRAESFAEDKATATATAATPLDEVLCFGTADASNHRELAAVKDIVERNIGSGIRVLVRRETHLLALELIPQTWSGSGVLGCLLRPT
uniref:Nas2 N-terminal domain-containing protein n=1 Tax=Hyaloperonospora arabidopsidis (strain Emoy2) TaxID=559515 RepID=M4C5J2_HYAAE